MTRVEANAVVFPGAVVTTLARLVDAAGELLQASDLSAIRLQVFESGETDPTVIGPLSVTNVAVATSTATNNLVTTGGWRADSKGHNFSHSFDIASYLTGGRTYRMEYRITTSGSGVLYVITNLVVVATGQAAS